MPGYAAQHQKVTVAYDGSLLEEGVFVYIKSVQIKDIPSTCLLEAKIRLWKRVDSSRRGKR